MHVELASFLRGSRDADEAAEIIGNCVHCGFCLATCPTYQLLGDERDSPRGRIYLIKQVLEGAPATASTQRHLDRCLTCRNCETTCPSGVKYGRLLDVGRHVVDAQVARSTTSELQRASLRRGLTGPLFAPALKLGQAVRPLLPAALREKIPLPQRAGASPTRTHARRMVLLAGCVQPAMQPNINAATARVFDTLGVQFLIAPQAACCGAIRHHLDDLDGSRADARRNIDAWLPLLDQGAEAIVTNASGCGVQVKDYAHLLRDDPDYSGKATRIAAATRDVAELMLAFIPSLHALLKASPSAQRIVFHPPCTLQHGQRLGGVVESMLAALGVTVSPISEGHLCCGSAGTYSVLQPQLSRALRARKLAHLEAPAPDLILSANIGCIAHLQAAAARPVRHWIEWLDDRLRAIDGSPAGTHAEAP